MIFKCFNCEKSSDEADRLDAEDLPPKWTAEPYPEIGDVVYFCPKCTRMLDAAPAVRERKQPLKLSEIELTDKQLKVLQIIYEIDQQREYANKPEYNRTFKSFSSTPASEWRWICYGISMEKLVFQLKGIPVANQIDAWGYTGEWFAVGGNELHYKIQDAGLDSRGLGKIFSTLAEKTLILHESRFHKTGSGAVDLTFVQMTRRGRRYIREITEEI